MNYNNIKFPYPVLKKNDNSILSYIDFSNEDIEITPSYDLFNFKINLSKIDNDDILKLIETGKTEYCVEVNCSSTLFRKVHTSRENIIEFSIPKLSLRGKVEGDCLIIARENIPDYNNSQAHEDYQGFYFNIKRGNILAYYGSFNFIADINYKKLKAVASIMEITEGDVEYLNVDLDNNKITLQLPKQDFKIYAQPLISKYPDLSPIFHSSIVYGALLTALYNFENYTDKLWAQAILYRMKEEEELKKFLGNDEKFDKAEVPDIAQILLGNPVRRLLNHLDKEIETTDEE